MATAFSPAERAAITRALLESAWKHASGGGMRKTSVEELALDAGISKGAFYKFYPSKEMLFLSMMEKWHEAICDDVRAVLEANAQAPGPERAAQAMCGALAAMRRRPLNGFIENELPLLLRRLPAEAVRGHYLSDEDIIHSMIRLSRVRLTVGENVADAAIRLIFLSVIHAPQIGPAYDEAARQLIFCACRGLIAPDVSSA